MSFTNIYVDQKTRSCISTKRPRHITGAHHIHRITPQTQGRSTSHIHTTPRDHHQKQQINSTKPLGTTPNTLLVKFSMLEVQVLSVLSELHFLYFIHPRAKVHKPCNSLYQRRTNAIYFLPLRVHKPSTSLQPLGANSTTITST